MTSHRFNADAFIAAAGDAIIVADPRGAITVWNAAAERIFGFSAEDALGRSLDLIIPERQRGRHWEGYEGTMETGRTKYGASVLRVPALHKSGRTISIAFTVTLMRDAAGAVEGIAAIIREETDRWNEERALRKSVQELKARLGEG